MDITARTITEYVDALETAKADAEHHLTTLGEACRRAIVDLSNALEALTNGHQSAPHAPEPDAEPASAAPEPRMSREESRKRAAGIDAAVLTILTDPNLDPTTAMTVAGIAELLRPWMVHEGWKVDVREAGRIVSSSLQRLAKRTDVDVHPGAKKGYWLATAMAAPAENGTHAEHHVAEDPAPEDDASALEEAGVVSGDAWPSPDEYTRL